LAKVARQRPIRPLLILGGRRERRHLNLASGRGGRDLASIEPVTQATIAATVVEMDDGRLALLVEMEPDPGLGPVVIDPVGGASSGADPDGLEAQD
jgi:hypothetical protein